VTTPAASRKNKWGQRTYPVPHPETHEIHDLPSFTGLKGLLHSGGLETWKLKNVAKQIALRTDLQCLAADDSGTYQAVQQALDMSRSSANIGTAIHRYCEYVDGGTLDWDTVPVAAKTWVKAYADAKERWGWTVVEAEVTVANLTAGYAGTADRFVDIPGFGLVCMDLKTGKDVYPETALQLGAYSSAEFIWRPPADSELPAYFAGFKQLSLDIARGENFTGWGSLRAKKWSEAAKKKAYDVLDEVKWKDFAEYKGHRPMPEGLRTDLGIVALLHEDGCQLIPLKLDGSPSAIEIVSSLSRIWAWNQRGKDVVGEPITKETDANCSDSAVPTEPVAVVESADDQESPSSDYTGTPALSAKQQALAQPVTRGWLVTRIQSLPEPALQDLVALWPEGVPTLKASDEHTPDQLESLDGVLARVEAKFELPFVAKAA
jgi:hypothetical protein